MLSKTDKPVSPTDAYCPDCDRWWDTINGEGCEVPDGLGVKTICPDCASNQGYTLCEHCEKWKECVDCDGSNYCEDCADDKGFAECEGCHKWLEDCHDCDGTTYCTDCANDNGYHSCDGCDEWHEDVVECGHDYYCEDCARRKGWSRCEGCDEWVRYASSGSDGNDYCESCWSDRFFVCDDCGNTFDLDDCCSNNRGMFCSDCTGGRENYDAKAFSHNDNTYDRIGHRKFGVEIETDDCPDYEDFDGQYHFGAKDDGSINGKEFVSAVLSGDKGLKAVDDFCKAANRNGFSVNDDCGLHVHFDMREENVDSMKAIYLALRMTYDVWAACVDESRVGAHYCAEDKTDLAEVYKVSGNYAWQDYCNHSRRYKWLNINAYSYHSTFEVRLHHGSCDGREICNWVRGLSLFIDWAARNDWRVIRNSLIAKTPSQKWEFICKIWSDCGASDLIEYYQDIVERNGLAVGEECAA